MSIDNELATIGIIIGPKGRGSNMLAIAKACERGEIPARVGVVISPIEDTPAVLNARAHGLNVAIVPPTEEGYGEALLHALEGCGWVCLAGYLRLLPVEVLRAFPNRIINIHPALLPKFGGKGMYGIRVHQAVIDAGEKESGASVHYVTEHYDEGAVILQLRCPVQPDDTPESLAARVLEQEHKAYAMALRQLIEEDRRGA
jgi:phosphoribosylglycinamide formyltransferase 1